MPTLHRLSVTPRFRVSQLLKGACLIACLVGCGENTPWQNGSPNGGGASRAFGGSWDMNDGRTHTLTIVEKSTYLSLKHPAQAMGQIHDPNDDTFMLRAVGNNDGNGQRSTSYSLTAQFDNSSIKKPLTLPGGAALWIPLDAYITLELIVKSGVCTVNVTHNGQLYSVSNATWATTDPTNNYFKAGNDIQSNVADYAESPVTIPRW